MLSILKIRKLMFVAMVSAGISLGSGVTNASNCHHPHVYYKTVIVYQTVRQPVVHWVTRYDDCGLPYRAKVATYKRIQVPVHKRVRAYF